ncbi:hypothetical protein, variant 2 [Aphanomyces invadans]|uniref:Uncharacterized protein n=1 Tax=Aphanomyces invadans TaxID=157072 RepID=A0A024UGQ0_9STRA|nr:hypothetical protein, variant 2 [Aphanomyces invadans]ETW05601.1 hypothetical protein, variant 2 [Aphanomyces invadans]|eukprot:XP_008865378.1 hypothetical protein, variant 2 [Aphanomyces invadans]
MNCRFLWTTTMGGFLQQNSQFPDLDKYKCWKWCAHEPLMLDALSAIMHFDVYQAQKAQSNCGSPFHLAEGEVILPFDLSLLSWLMDSRSAGEYFVDVGTGHETIGLGCCDEYESSVTSGNDISKLEGIFPSWRFRHKLESSQRKTSTQRMQLHIVRHATNHLEVGIRRGLLKNRRFFHGCRFCVGLKSHSVKVEAFESTRRGRRTTPCVPASIRLSS